MVSYHLRNILSALRNADQNYSLIDEGDRIVVGVSGGKDSLTLLYALSLYGRFAKKNFILYPVLLDLGFRDSYDFEPLKDFVSSLRLKLEIVDARFVYPALKAHTKPGKHLSCSLCSRMKKAAMKDIAQKKKANKIAFAHHQDDLLETLFMNILHSGKISAFTPKMLWEKEDITFIRPLYDVQEKEIRAFAKEMNLPIFDLGCEANHHTEREDIKEFLSSLYKRNPDNKKNLSKSLLNYDGFELPFS
ncbi:MAG TPA: tRNA 2-thiocytidine(32) synthetase TtcA, partial [Firmicutes bacterium]|nr:tRNA 2-thiocytidine(32) synthetase TtcA [Bacillota bacterium]